MENHFEWSAPVVLRLCPQTAKERAISDTRDAAHFLLSEWQWVRGSSHDHALRACGLVLIGVIDPEVARNWLIRAAQEASVELAQV